MADKASAPKPKSQKVAQGLHARGVNTHGVEHSNLDEESQWGVLGELKRLADERDKAAECDGGGCFASLIGGVVIVAELVVIAWLAWASVDTRTLTFSHDSEAITVTDRTWWGRQKTTSELYYRPTPRGDMKWSVLDSAGSQIVLPEGSMFSDGPGPRVLWWLDDEPVPADADADADSPNTPPSAQPADDDAAKTPSADQPASGGGGTAPNSAGRP